MVKQTIRVLCLTPTPGKQGTRIDKWKYDVVRRAILKSVPRNGSGTLFKELPDTVKQSLSPDELARLGSVSWYTTTVKLDMEVKGEIYRVPGVSPQHLLRR
jgi:hypothetical protein